MSLLHTWIFGALSNTTQGRAWAPSLVCRPAGEHLPDYMWYKHGPSLFPQSRAARPAWGRCESLPSTAGRRTKLSLEPKSCEDGARPGRYCSLYLLANCPPRYLPKMLIDHHLGRPLFRIFPPEGLWENDICFSKKASTYLQIPHGASLHTRSPPHERAQLECLATRPSTAETPKRFASSNCVPASLALARVPTSPLAVLMNFTMRLC